jgi:hypothetical protein
MALIEHGGISEHRFQHGCDIGVTGGLVARQGARIPAQQRQVLSNKLRTGHPHSIHFGPNFKNQELRGEARVPLLELNTRQDKKSSPDPGTFCRTWN